VDNILYGIFALGVSFLYDAFIQVVDFCRGGYLDKLLWQKVWDAIISFTLGYLIVAGMIYFLIMLTRGH